MNHDDKDDQSPSSEEKEETQLEFDRDSFSDNPRRLEPVFDDFELESDDSLEEQADEAEETFERAGYTPEPEYNAEFEEDSIDYDIDPESLSEDEPFEQDPEPEEAWHAEELKPELVREPEEVITAEIEAPAEESNDWPEEEVYDDETEGQDAPWPMGLIIVAVVALLLLGAGGYGVMQQRASMQEEIRTLQAAVATSASPAELTNSREVQRQLKEKNQGLQATIDAMGPEIQALRDTIRGLELQLAAVTSVPAAKPATKPAPKPVAAKPVASVPQTGNWFVNFGSYQKRDTANSWSTRLKPTSGKVVVIPSEKSGDTYYRVRVVNIGSKSKADSIARALEKEYGLSKLWVGQQ